MESRNDELERFKREIDLREYADSVGYKMVKRKSTKQTWFFERGADKVIIGRGIDDHFIYFSVVESNDKGSIIDFIKNRCSKNLGEIRKELRPWIRVNDHPRPPVKTQYAPIVATEKDREAVLAEYSKQVELDSINIYLTKERLIPESVYLSDRFKGKIYTDKYRNAVFPHYDEKGLCGFEKKNKGFTGFSKGGIKTVWISNFMKVDNELIIVESGIEALSHYTLFKPSKSRYISMSGSWSPEAMKIVSEIANNFDGQVTTAFNNDEGGRKLEERFREEMQSRDIKSIYPEKIGYDWNNMVKGEC